MPNAQLRQIYSIEDRAKAAQDTKSLHAARDVVGTFVRLREEAKEINRHVGWPNEDFEREVPPWQEHPAVAASRIGAITGNPGENQALLARAHHCLGQLEGWAHSMARVIEFETKLKVEAELKRAAEAATPPTRAFGFQAEEDD
jgi:hypothetical protein